MLMKMEFDGIKIICCNVFVSNTLKFILHRIG